MIIKNDIHRLSLHDSKLLEVFVNHNEMELLFNWSKLENPHELNLNEAIILGKTSIKFTGVNSEEISFYSDTSKRSTSVLPKDFIKELYIITGNDFQSVTNSVKIHGLYKSGNAEMYEIVDWCFGFESCQISWTSHVTVSNWLNGASPVD
jgi:hypothetical protein